jgi:hypothetical protein
MKIMDPIKKISKILEEFYLSGWYCSATKNDKIIKIQPSPGSHKHYFLVKLDNDDWGITNKQSTYDNEHAEALAILNRARVMTSDRTSVNAIAPTFSALNKLKPHYRGKMANIVRIDYNRFINFDHIRDIEIQMNKDSVECTIYWFDGDCSAFSGESAQKILGLAELFAIAALNDLQLEGDEDEDAA